MLIPDVDIRAEREVKSARDCNQSRLPETSGAIHQGETLRYKPIVRDNTQAILRQYLGNTYLGGTLRYKPTVRDNTKAILR